MVGLEQTKSDINDWIGNRARAVKLAMDGVRDVTDWLSGMPNQSLLDLGFTQAEVDTLVAAYNRLGHLRNVWVGDATVDTAEDFRTFPRRIWGLGVRSTVE